MDTFRGFIKFRNLVVVFVAAGLLGCDGNGSSFNDYDNSIAGNTDIGVPGDGNNDTGTDPLKPPINKVNFCSRLELNAISWPSALSELEIDSYALALNITGSFEGHSDWRNITNNFDDQGISLGIFQQNLGQGSLQPLLIEVAQEHELIYRQFFTKSQTESIFSMLQDWDADSGLSLASVQTKLSRSPSSVGSIVTEDSLTNFYSPLDIAGVENVRPINNQNGIFAKASSSANQRGVDWAIRTLYESDGRTFKSDWKRGFQNLAGDPRYVSKQVKAGHIIHQKAMKFMEVYGTRELKSYLFFFDIVVQNGGIRESTRQDYLAEVNQTPNMSENDKMKVLIKHRVLRSREQYRADVLSRKLAILNGEGRVHKTDRDFREEFCTNDYDKNIK